MQVKKEKGNTLLKAVLKSKWYPGVFQIPVLIVFAFITYELFFGPASAHQNFGTALTWILWWPLIPLVFLMFGRFWCAICPFATVSDFIQKVVGNNRPVPNFLKKYGIWIIDIFFILITWGDHVFGIVESPLGSGVMMMIIATGVITAGAFFERRTWCRYLCFLGGVAGNYSRAGAVELRGTAEKCSRCTVMACYRGGDKAPGCPMFEFPKAMDNNARCNLCGYCVKNCPNDSITIAARMPSKELWFIRNPKYEESFLAIVIMGIVFVQNITMLAIWEKAQAWLEMILGTHQYAVTFTVTFLVAMAIPVALLYMSSWQASRSNEESVNKNFARFGYSLIPLDLAGHMAHNLFHLLAEGKAILYTGMAAAGMGVSNQSAALVSTGTIQILQYVLLAAGAFGSVYTAYRIAKNNYSTK
ncbi:MAG: 4Fe-4S ferredoxin iron-sulfur binding protein, partial [Firmicutes bacterium]|nr:4Fe-4S ferredoxin iron-sulfur binding protein [Bacillota bacterium]